MCHFLFFCALHKIQNLLHKRGSKCATFAQNHNIWTHCAQELWMTEDEDEGDADHVHFVWAAAGGNLSTPVLHAMIKQGTMRGLEIKCTPDMGAMR